MNYMERIIEVFFICSCLIITTLCCPERCICDTLVKLNMVTVRCRSRGYKHFPRDVPNNTYFLDLQGNDIRELKQTDFTNMTGLVRLSLANVSLVDIKPRTFHGLESLEDLNLVGNKLSTIEKNTFAWLPRLVALDLSYNFIVKIHPGSFGGLPKLNYLSLGSNQLNSLSISVF